MLEKDQPEEGSVQTPDDVSVTEKEKPEIEALQAPNPIALEKEPTKKEEALLPADISTLENKFSENKPLQTPESPTLPHSICGIAACITSILFWIIIGLSAIAHEALQPKTKHFLLDPISYTLERIFLLFLQPFVEIAKASVIASGAGMLAALILGIIGLLESQTDKTLALLGCTLSVFGLIPSLIMIFR